MLKTLARLFVENLHINQDANYRKMIITTYIAMLQDPDTPITPGEREHALKAIFAPANGAVAPIVMPMENVLKLGKK